MVNQTGGSLKLLTAMKYAITRPRLVWSVSISANSPPTIAIGADAIIPQNSLKINNDVKDVVKAQDIVNMLNSRNAISCGNLRPYASEIGPKKRGPTT